MKKIYVCCAFFILMSGKSEAQRNSISTTGKWGQQIFISDVNGQSFVNKYDEIAGEVYDNSSYRLAKITLKDGRIYNDVKARINLLEHEVNFIASNGQEGYLGKGMATEIIFTGSVEPLLVQKIFQCGFPPIDNQNRISFYQVIYDGKTSLLKSVFKTIQDRNNEISGERFKEFATYENFYLLKEGAMIRVKKDKTSLLSLLEDKKKAIAIFMEEQKLNIRNENHLIALIKYYNSL